MTPQIVSLVDLITLTPAILARYGLLIMSAFLLLAAWSDLRHQRIPNFLVAIGSVLAILIHSMTPGGDGLLGNLPGGLGFLGALGGMSVGLLSMLPLYMLGGMGAGDVKLLGMVGAFLGVTDFWYCLLASLLVFALLASAVLMHRRIVGQTGSMPPEWFAASPRALPVARHAAGNTLPFGVAIAGGSIAYIAYRAQMTGLI